MKLTYPYKEVVAIGGDHFNTLWLVRALGMAGYEPTCIIVGAKHGRSFVGKSKYSKRCYTLANEDDIVPLLKSLSFPKRTVVITTSDKTAEILDANYNFLSEKYILCNCGEKENGIINWMDKKNQLSCAEKCGLPIPFSKTIRLNEELDLKGFKFPVLVKPEASTEATKATFRICRDEDELLSAINEIGDVCQRAIVQEFIDHENEYLMYGVCYGDKVLIPGGTFKTLTCTDTKNLGMHVYGFATSKQPVQFTGIDAVKRFVQSIHYQGIFSVEVIITKENYFFLEINMRNDGTCYITTQAGVNIPAIWTSYCYGYDLSLYSTSFKREKTYGLNGVNYLKYGLKKTGVIGTIKNVMRTKAFSLYKCGDIKPLMYKILYH